MREPLNLHSLLLESLDDAVIATDADGAVIYWNLAAERLYGFASEEVLGHPIYEVTVPSLSDARAREIMESLRQGESWRGEFEVQRKDGTRFLADVRNVPVLGEQGEISTIIGLSRDISVATEQARDREQLITALAEANRAKDEFLALISHELRTPLTTILGFAELMTKYEDQVNRQVLRESLLDIRDAARRMNRTVQNLLALARLELQPEVELEPVLINSVLGSAVRQHKDQNPERQITVEFENEVERVLAKTVYLDHIFENLLSNAEKYSPVSEPIEVLCKREQNRITVSVMDRGAGIEPGQLERLFEPFYRAPSAESTFGAGLGLTVCKRLMQLQHGEIWIEEREGGGTCFQIALPIFTGR